MSCSIRGDLRQSGKGGVLLADEWENSNSMVDVRSTEKNGRS